MIKNYIQISEILKVLGHPVRLHIVAGLIKNEYNITHIQQCLGVSQSTISQHLRTLKNAGIIEERRNGTNVYYKVINNLVIKIIKKIEEIIEE